MVSCKLIVLPGNGCRNLTVAYGTTIRQLVTREGVQGRSIILNGRTLTTSELDKEVSEGMEIAATESVKGA